MNLPQGGIYRICEEDAYTLQQDKLGGGKWVDAQWMWMP